MNIWLPIITNVIIALIVIAGIFVGKKNGFALEFGKLILLAGATVGCYFLLPVVTPLLNTAWPVLLKLNILCLVLL